MNERMLELRQQRGELLARIAVQRGQVGEMVSRCEVPLALADQGLAALRFLRGHPLLVGGVAALLVWRRKGLVGLFRRSWLLWKGYRYLVDFRNRQVGSR